MGRGVAGRLLVAALLGCLALLAFSPGAFAASGSISGEVTEFAGKKPVQGATVRVYRENGEFAGAATTEAIGKYEVGPLSGGNYEVEFSRPGFATQYYLEKPSFGAATPVPVMEGKETEEINAALKKLGKIAGTVTESGSNKPISGLIVEVSNLAGEFVADATTNGEGKYEVIGLATGTYKVGFNLFGELNYVPQYYNNQPSFETATLVQVEVEKTSQANAAMQIGGEIVGRVTDAGTGAPVARILVVASKTEGIEGFGSAETNANGEYRVFGLGTGFYRVDFLSQPGQVQYIAQSVIGIPVTQGRATPGINVALVRRAPVNTAAPVLSGTPAVGQTLSCSTGTWTGVPLLTFAYSWLRDGSVIGGASGNTYVVQPADQGHALTCRVTAKNSVSSASAISNALKVQLPPPPPPPPPLTLESVSQSNSRWREGGGLASYSRRRAPVGTTFRFVVNQQASVSFAFTQQLGGRKVGRKCVAQTRANRRRPGCKRTVTQGTLTFTGHSGLNKVAFQGRISRSKKLPLGAYTLQITAVNSAGKRSSPRTLNFTIVK